MPFFQSSGYQQPWLPGWMGALQAASNNNWRRSVWQQTGGDVNQTMNQLAQGGDPWAMQTLMANRLSVADREDRQSHDKTMFGMRQEAARQAALADAQVRANTPNMEEQRALIDRTQPLIAQGRSITGLVGVASQLHEEASGILAQGGNMADWWKTERGTALRAQYDQYREQYIYGLKEQLELGVLSDDEYERLALMAPASDDITGVGGAENNVTRLYNRLAVADAELRAQLQNEFISARQFAGVNVPYSQVYNDALSDAVQAGLIDPETLQPAQVNYEKMIQGDKRYQAAQEGIQDRDYGGGVTGRPLAPLPPPEIQNLGNLAGPPMRAEGSYPTQGMEGQGIVVDPRTATINERLQAEGLTAYESLAELQRYERAKRRRRRNAKGTRRDR